MQSGITLTLDGFRCYETETSYNFPSSEVIRIKGRSGAGKTTILEAIQWVLYNTPTTNIYSRNSKNKKCSVTLTLSGMVITRKKNPSRLVITYLNGKEEEDDVAQASIISLFGSKDIWRACSYLPQESICPLLSFSNLQRMEILESLAFLNEKPEEDIRKINTEIKSLEIEYQGQDKIYQYQLENLGEEKEDKYLDKETHLLSLQEEERLKIKLKNLNDIIVLEKSLKEQIRGLDLRIDKLNKSLDDLPSPSEEEISDLNTDLNNTLQLLPQVQKEEKKRIQVATLEKQLEQAKVKLESLPEIKEEEILELEKEIKEYQLKLPLCEAYDQRKKLEESKMRLENELLRLPEAPREYTIDEYYETLGREKKLAEEKSILTRYKLRRQEVKEEQEEIKALLEGQKDALVWKNISSLKAKLVSLDGIEVDHKDLEKAKEELKSVERSIDAIKCPSCRRSLRYIRGRLVLSETSPVPKDKLEALKKALLEMEVEYKKSHDRKVITAQLESLSSTVKDHVRFLTSKEKSSLEQKLNALNTLQFPEEVIVSSKEISGYQKYIKIRDKLNGIKEELLKYPSNDLTGFSSSTILNLIDKRASRANKLRSLLPKREGLQEQVNKYKQSIDEIQLNSDYTSYSSKKLIREIDNYRKEITYLQGIVVRRDDLVEQLNSYLVEKKLLQGKSKGKTLEFLQEKQKGIIERQEELKSILASHLEAEAFLVKKKVVEASLEKVTCINKELGSAYRLRDLALREECEILEEKVEIVNAYITEVCNKIFTEPISIQLSMLKTGKTTKVTKPHVHLNIQYKGGEYDSLSQLSGGEGKRISIAVSLALAKLNKFPLLLLDECLAGLDEELKESTLEILKEAALDKTILCIMHDGVEGYYDSTVVVK